MKVQDLYHPSDQLIFKSLEEKEYELTSEHLLNIRERHFPKDHKLHLHYHNTLEININHGVSGTIWIEGDSLILEEHKILIIPPGMMHSYFFRGGAGTFDVMHISLTELQKYINLDPFFGSDRIRLGQLPVCHSKYEPVEDIINAVKTVGEHNILGQLQYILQLFAHLLNSPVKEESSRRYSCIKKIIAYTEKNFHKPITLDSISEHFGYSKAYFSRYFKKETGTGYFTYLQQLRLEKAKDFMRDGYIVSDSCYLSGFENLSYFVQIFKKHNDGLTPGAFKKLVSERP